MQWIKKLFVKRPQSVSDILTDLYSRIDGVYISKCERFRLEINDTSFTYGEIEYESFRELLSGVCKPTDKVFYDLGSGTGKAVFCAGLSYDWQRCIGVELLPGLFQVSEALQERLVEKIKKNSVYLTRMQAVLFQQENFLQADIVGADVVFINATTMNPVVWGELIQRLKRLKVGARVLVSTRKVEESEFHKLSESMVEMSWGFCTVRVYERC